MSLFALASNSKPLFNDATQVVRGGTRTVRSMRSRNAGRSNYPSRSPKTPKFGLAMAVGLVTATQPTPNTKTLESRPKDQWFE